MEDHELLRIIISKQFDIPKTKEFICMRPIGKTSKVKNISKGISNVQFKSQLKTISYVFEWHLAGFCCGVTQVCFQVTRIEKVENIVFFPIFMLTSTNCNVRANTAAGTIIIYQKPHDLYGTQAVSIKMCVFRK